MKRFKFSLFWLSLLGVTVGSIGAAAAPVGDFTLLDHRGKSHQLSWYGDQKAVVIFIQGNGSPAVRSSVPGLNKIRDEFESQGVAFFMLNPQLQDNRTSIAEEAQSFGYDFPILVDETQLVAESLGVERVAETLVVDPKTMTVVFRGAFDAAGLNAVLSGQAVAKGSSAVSGGQIKYGARHQQHAVSYTQDIVPILKDNCVACHHDGAIGPWSMSSHTMVRGWSKMMR